jgi:hypothetical protein
MKYIVTDSDTKALEFYEKNGFRRYMKGRKEQWKHLI